MANKMDINRKVKITTPKQFDKLVELMEKNPHLAKGFAKSLTKFNIKDDWNKVGEKINYLGPPVRTGEGWKKVWEDFKLKLKKKILHNKAEVHATGGGPFKQFILSATDEAAANLLQLRSIISPEGQTFGTKRRLSVLQDPDEIDVDDSINDSNNDENEEPSTSQPITKKPVKKPEQKKAVKKPEEKNQLLSKQLQVQTDLYTEVKLTLKEIERYSRKRFKIEEETLKLYKAELTKKDIQRNSLLQLRNDELEIKKKKLDLEELRSHF